VVGCQALGRAWCAAQEGRDDLSHESPGDVSDGPKSFGMELGKKEAICNIWAGPEVSNVWRTKI
jgi:hypothetical protein